MTNMILIILSSSIILTLSTFPLYCNQKNIPLDYYSIANINYLNLFPYFQSSLNQNSYTILNQGQSLQITGNFGFFYMDLNHSFQMSATVDYTIAYSCTQMNIFIPSLGKYWNINTDAEVMVTCTLSGLNNVSSLFPLNNTVRILFPVMTFQSSGANIFTYLSSVIGNQNISIGNSIQTTGSLDIKTDVLTTDDIRVLIYNYFNFDNCSVDNNTYIVWNSIISIQQSDFTFLQSFFFRSSITTGVISKTYSYLPSQVYINWVKDTTNQDFEKMLLTYQYNSLTSDSKYISLSLLCFLLISFLLLDN